MLSLNAEMDVSCCKSVGTDLSMLDIEDFISQICQLKKEVAKLRERGDKDRPGGSAWSFPNRDLERCMTLRSASGFTDAQEKSAEEQQTPMKTCRHLIQSGGGDEEQHLQMKVS